jgi:hypothetical protein
MNATRGINLLCATGPRRIKSSLPVHHVVRRSLRYRAASIALFGAALFASASPWAYADPTPAPAATLNAEEFNQRLKQSILEKKPLPTPMTPEETEHVVLVVETNKRGQVTRVRYNGSHGSSNDTFNAMAYGNALQAWIRTEDGKAIPGTYRLVYDYSPDTQKVRRTVELLKAGGVDPNAIGAVEDMAKQNMRKMAEDRKAYQAAVARAKAKKAHAAAKATPTPHPSPKP